MKRIISILLIALLLLPVIGRYDHADAAEETIVRVRLSTGDAASVSVSLSGKYAVDDKTVSGGTVTASIDNGTITVEHSSQGTLQTSKTSVRLRRVGTDSNTKLTFQNAKHGKLVYYGDFVFYNDGGTLRVINYVDMQNYLYGVVSGELSDSSKPDLLKTEAITAKGFALAEVETRASKYFDVYDTTQSQLYYGYIASDKNTIAAVDAVWKQTLRFGGKTVKTYYSTANGGQMITPRIRWGGTANDGAYSFGYDPFDLAGSSKNVSVTVDGASPGKMDANLSAFLLQKTGAKELVSVDSLIGVYDPDNPNGTARYPSTLAPQKRYDWTLTVKDSAGVSKQVSFSCTPDELKTAVAPSASGAICFAVHTAQKQWKLVWGVNSGHRAGLSHRGATQMVNQGYSYVDVLKFYYRGATLYDENGKAIESTATFAFTYEDGTAPQPTASVKPTATPTASPTSTPTAMPSSTPAASTTPAVSATPTAAPTASAAPTATPTVGPTPAASPTSTAGATLPPIDHEVIVTANTLNFREGPSTSTALLGTCKLGTILSVISESDGWLHVYDEQSGKIGYVSASYASYYERDPKIRWEGVCNADDSNLRTGPSTNFQKLYPIDKDNPLYVYYRSGNWYYVMDRRTGQNAFVYYTYVTLGAAVSDVLNGDANGDGTVNVIDASLILRHVVGLSTIEDANLPAADVNGDGTIDAADAAKLLRQIVGLE